MPRFFKRDRTFRSKDALVSALKEWLATDESTVGDKGNFGGKPWVRVELGENRFVLNSDTDRSGVSSFVHNHRGGGTRWFVKRNENGRVNKVTNSTSRTDIPGFYFYVDPPGPRVI